MNVAERIEKAAADLIAARTLVPKVRLHHGYARGGLDPVLTLLYALHRWSMNEAHYTARGVAETAEGVLCDACALDAARWSVVGALERTNFNHRFWREDYEWPIIADDFVRDAAVLLARGEAALRPAAALLHVDAHARRLSLDERIGWISETFAARERAVREAIDHATAFQR